MRQVLWLGGAIFFGWACATLGSACATVDCHDTLTCEPADTPDSGTSGDSSSRAEVGAENDAAMDGDAADSALPTDASPLSCDKGQIQCGNACVNTGTDPKHCG